MYGFLTRSFPRSAWLPANLERLLGCNGRKDRQTERSDLANKPRQVADLFGESTSTHECSPLDRTGGIIAVRSRQANRFGFNNGSSVMEGRDDRFRQKLSLEWIHAGEKGEIVEVFHSAVEDAESREGFQFLGNDGLFGLGAEYRCREIQQAWVLNVRGPGSNDIAESDIDLHWNSRSCERCVELDPDTLVIRVLLDPADLD